MIVKAIECPVCGDKIYSRCDGDKQNCCCGYASISGHPTEPTLSPLIEDIELIDLEVNATENDLFIDWNLKYDQFGIISEFADQLDSYLK